MIIFMGTPQFSVPILQYLIDEKYDLVVVTQPDKAVGRKKVLTPSPVKRLAQAHHIKVLQPIKLRDDYQAIIDLKPSLIITAAYGQILPKVLLEAIPAINIHGSLLPTYRGGAPIQYSLFNGDLKTGVTLMEMVYKMDAGDMIEKVEMDILDTDNYETLSARLSLAGRDLLAKRLMDILNRDYQKTKQDEAFVSFAYTLKYEDEALDFNRSIEWNHNRVRGLSPNIGAHFEVHGTLVKVFKSSLSDIIDLPVGHIRIVSKRLFIGCLDGALEILELQQSGKKQLLVKDYLNGQNLFVNGGQI